MLYVNILLVGIFMSPGDEDMRLSLVAGSVLLLEAIGYGLYQSWQHRRHTLCSICGVTRSTRRGR